MTKKLSNSYSVINLHKKPSTKSEVVTQMLYGESFSILKRNGRWLKIKIKEDGYKGYIQNKIFSKFLKPISVYICGAQVTVKGCIPYFSFRIID